MRYRMIAIDLDGTLLCPRGTVTPRVKQAVHKCLQAGFLVVFATGRNWTECNAILETVDHYDAAVFVGGAMVADTRNRVTLHRTMMDASLARELCAAMEVMGQAVLALQDHHVTGVDYLVTQDAPLNDATRLWMSATTASYQLVPRLADHPHEHTIRVGLCAGPEQVQRVKREIEARFPGRVVIHNLMVPAYGVEVLEMFDPNVNKWEGIQHVARRHDVKPEEIVAIGDDMNDIAMISRAGLGVAMGNARPEVKALAKKIIGANADEGLAEFLEELAERQAAA